MRPSRCSRCLGVRAQHRCGLTPSFTPRAQTPLGSLQLHHCGTAEVTTPGGDLGWDPGNRGEKNSCRAARSISSAARCAASLAGRPVPPHLNPLPPAICSHTVAGQLWGPWGSQTDPGDPSAPDSISQLHLVETARSGHSPPGTPATGWVKPTPGRVGGQAWP